MKRLIDRTIYTLGVLVVVLAITLGGLYLYRQASHVGSRISMAWAVLTTDPAEASQLANPANETVDNTNSAQVTERLAPISEEAVIENAVVLSAVDTLHHGAWDVTFYEGATDQMHGWFEDLRDPDPANWPDFPNVDNSRVNFEAANGLEYGLDERNYCDNDICDVLVQARGYNFITAEYDIAGLECHASDGVGCGVVLFNVGEVTANFEDVMVNNGFSVDGRYWNGDELHQAIWGIVSHGSANMLNYATNGAGDDTLNNPGRTNAGANCSVVDGCAGVLWRVVITSGNQILVVAETTVR